MTRKGTGYFTNVSPFRSFNLRALVVALLAGGWLGRASNSPPSYCAARNPKCGGTERQRGLCL